MQPPFHARARQFYDTDEDFHLKPPYPGESNRDEGSEYFLYQLKCCLSRRILCSFFSFHRRSTSDQFFFADEFNEARFRQIRPGSQHIPRGFHNRDDYENEDEYDDEDVSTFYNTIQTFSTYFSPIKVLTPSSKSPQEPEFGKYTRKDRMFSKSVRSKTHKEPVLPFLPPPPIV